MLLLNVAEQKIKNSTWWQKANTTIDSHFSNTSGIMLTHHLQAVYNNVDALFNKTHPVFYTNIFKLLASYSINTTLMQQELKIIALLHDIGKIAEDKTKLVAHPLTGKKVPKRHGLVSLLAAIDILQDDLMDVPTMQQHIYCVTELHDYSFGLYRDFLANKKVPDYAIWHHLNHTISSIDGIGILYLLLFKLADTHGHHNIDDVIWFFETAQKNYFSKLHITIPIPEKADIV